MKNKSINLLYRSGHFFFVYLRYFSLMCACFVVIISFFFECCLLYSLSPYSVVLFFFFFFFFTCISIVCVRVFFFNKQRPFFGLLNMRCLKRNLIYERYQVLFCPSYFFLMSLWTGYRKKKKKRWAKY
jgi:hypothetical protein